MAKFTLPTQFGGIEDQCRSSMRIPTSMLPLIEKDIVASGFNRKQRNLWLVEVINDLLANPDYANLVAEEFILPGSTSSMSIILSQQLDNQIAEALMHIKNSENATKDRSALIRTAIIQRLMTQSTVASGLVTNTEMGKAG